MYFFSHPGVLSNPQNCLFSARFQSTDKAMKVRLSQMKTMMKHVKRAAEFENFDFSDLGWSVKKTTRLYEATESYFRCPAVHHRRFTDITCKTVFLLLQKNKFKLVGEVDEGINM